MTARVWPFFRFGSSRSFGASVLISAALLFSSPLALAQFTQQGPKLVGTGAVGMAVQGHRHLGGPGDNSVIGAVWVYTRSGGVWTRRETGHTGSS
jgi:hypothetical protein